MERIGGVYGLEGLTFYWISWVFWIIATFFMKKGKARLCISIWLLLIIIFSPYSLSLYYFEISYVSILLLSSLFVMISTIKSFKAAYVLVSSFIVMIAYVCFLLYELIDPVWLFIPRNWMLAMLLFSLALLLHAQILSRLMIILLGSIQGELLYAYILNKYSFPYLIGSYAYLDAIALSAGLLAGWAGFEFLTTFYEKHINQLEREKQKLS